jgi:hypothetical protein
MVTQKAKEIAMWMIWSPEQLLLLASVAMVIAFFFIGEMIEQKHPRRPMRIPSESERLAWATRHMPRAPGENLRNSRVAPERNGSRPTDAAGR